MSRKIPSDEEVVSAIQRVISKQHTVNSQFRMKHAVDEELKSVDVNYRVGGIRIRKLVLKSRYFHLEIDYRSPPEKKNSASGEPLPAAEAGEHARKSRDGKLRRMRSRAPKLAQCPVCGSRVKKILNRTLKGGSIVAGFKCIYCPYHTGIPARIPARYTFSIRRL